MNSHLNDNQHVTPKGNQTEVNLTDKPVWAAPERNKYPILQVLQKYVTDCQFALEIGSGTGQHAVYFASQLTHLNWQCTDQASYIEGIKQWVAEANLANLPMPITYDVNDGITTQLTAQLANTDNPEGLFDIIYTANTLHIMSWTTVETLFNSLPKLLKQDVNANANTNANAYVVCYGPFNYNGKFTSDSNASFDASLKQRDANMGIRDIADITQLAAANQLDLIEDVAMPANNRCLVFRYLKP